MFGIIGRRKKRRILFAWELGGGLGHVRPLLTIARALVAADPSVEASFALRDMWAAPDIGVNFRGAQVFRAPVYRRPASEPRHSASSYGDMLFNCGYADAAVLKAMLDAWDGLFREVNPHVIVCDHSPTVILAARDRVPVVHVGTGFTVPPNDRPFPVINSGAIAGAQAREAAVYSSIEQACRTLDRPVPASIPAMFGWSQNIVCCLPELDPYASIRHTPAAGPLEALPPCSPSQGNGSIFGYLSTEYLELRELLRSLARAGLKGQVYIRGGIGPFEECVAGSCLRLLNDPVDLVPVLREASAIVHHGGIGTTQTAMGVGRPQFVFPRHWEQRLTARAVEKLGTSVAFESWREAAATIQETIHRGKLQAGAVRLAHRLQHQAKASLSDVLTACRKP